MEQRFFVSVIAPDVGTLQRLNEYGLDLFRQTAKKVDQNEYTIDGLLSLQEVGKLVENGYRVLVKEDARKKNQGPIPVIDFDDWLKSMKEEG